MAARLISSCGAPLSCWKTSKYQSNWKFLSRTRKPSPRMSTFNPVVLPCVPGGKIFSRLTLTIVLPLGSRMASWWKAPRQEDPTAAGSGIAPHGPKSVEPGPPLARICCCKTPMLVSRTVLPARSISRRDSPGTTVLGFHEVPTWRVSWVGRSVIPENIPEPIGGVYHAAEKRVQYSGVHRIVLRSRGSDNRERWKGDRRRQRAGGKHHRTGAFGNFGARDDLVIDAVRS